ncbi:MAG: hypothetical protein ACR2OD_03430, partial [Gaiellaceae bacterium]
MSTLTNSLAMKTFVRCGAGLVAVFALTLASLIGADPASAISRAKAEAIALKTLGVKNAESNVIVFGLTKPLGPRQSVTLADAGNQGIVRPSSKRKRGLPKLGRKAWLFWADLVPYAHFTHPSAVLLIDDKTGRVIRDQMTGWYPLVDGRRPPFLRSPSAYNDKRWHVLRRLDETSGAAAVEPRSLATGLGPPPQFPADLFQHDCILLVGAHHDPHFTNDFKTMRQFGRQAGRATGQAHIKSWYATAAGRKPSPLPPERAADPA